jgi:acetyl-CoA C-acetyltransferase
MSASPSRVAILSAVRTPLGKFGGSLSRVPAPTLGKVVAEEALRRASVGPEQIEEVIFGCGIQAGLGQNPARQVLIRSGIPPEVGAVTVNKVCGSGMKSIMLAASEIRAGDVAIALAGGMESMSLAPFLLPARARWGLRLGDASLVDAVQNDALLDAYDHQSMGMTGEAVAKRFGISRAEADAFAVESHRRAGEASATGRFAQEIVPVPSPAPGGPPVGRDEGPRPDSTLESLASLKPSFIAGGILTAGNSSQLSDGAAALVLASEEAVQRRGLRPLAWIRSYHVGGVPPPRVMEAPIPTVQGHLAKEHLTIEEVDLFEHNEAFSTASIAVQRALRVPEGRFNVNGGAVALGHPIGCSGARITVTLLHEMLRRKAFRGLATLCMGGGNGTSLLLERAED